MASLELEAAQRHLEEVIGLGESQVVIARARQRVEDAMEGGSESVSQAGPTPLSAAQLPDRIIDTLQENAQELGDDRLLNIEGLREWVAEGNDLSDDLDGIGPKFKAAIEKAIEV